MFQVAFSLHCLQTRAKLESYNGHELPFRVFTTLCEVSYSEHIFSIVHEIRYEKVFLQARWRTYFLKLSDSHASRFFLRTPRKTIMLPRPPERRSRRLYEASEENVVDSPRRCP